jgi:hypothetical protein
MSVVDVLREAHEALRKAVPGKRLKAHREEGLLAQTFHEAMRIWDLQKAEGVSKADRVAGLAKALREAWPKSRDAAWRYLCDRCDDYGLVISQCPGDATCGDPKPHGAHSYGTPCWCEKGNRFKSPAPSPDDYTQAAKGKSRPVKKGFQRWNG